MEAAQLLLSRQEEAMSRLKGRGLTVKINSVVVPGINAGHITAIAEKAAEWGADVMNCIPIIPVRDTPFAGLGTPADAEMIRIRALASLHLPQMYHCQRCRADAVGLLCSEKS